MRTLALGLAFVVSIAGSSSAAEPEFQFSREVKAPAIKKEEILSVVLDFQVYAATQDRLADIRLVDGDGKTVPYILRKQHTSKIQQSKRSWPAKGVVAKPLDNNGLEITLKLDEKDPQPDGFRIISPLKNFEHRVRVETSDDGTAWKPAGQDAMIFDYSRFMDVRNDSVPLPDIKDRHFRIIIDNVTAEQQSQLLAITKQLREGKETERAEQTYIDRRPFRIDRIDFWHEVEDDQATGDEKKVYPAPDFRAEYDPEKRQTTIDVRTQREPLTSLEIQTQAVNFGRHASVEVERTQGAKTTWQKIGEGKLSCLNFKDLQRSDLDISFPETRASRYRIVIDDLDNQPLDFTSVEAKGNKYELIFLAGTNSQFQLQYGSPLADPPIYDTTALQEMLRNKFRPIAAELGPEARRPVGPAPAWALKDLFNNPVLLGSVIALLVLVLGWGLFRAVQRMDKLPNS